MVIFTCYKKESFPSAFCVLILSCVSNNLWQFSQSHIQMSPLCFETSSLLLLCDILHIHLSVQYFSRMYILILFFLEEGGGGSSSKNSFNLSNVFLPLNLKSRKVLQSISLWGWMTWPFWKVVASKKSQLPVPQSFKWYQYVLVLTQMRQFNTLGQFLKWWF